MTRLAVAGCMALAALSAVAVFDVGSKTAEAAPSASRFAGTYDWNLLPVTISDGGRIEGSVSYGGDEPFGYSQYETISGRVSADGSYSFTKSVTTYSYDGFGKRHLLAKNTSKSTGTMAPDTNGNIVGTAVTSESFVWLRR